MWTRRAGGGGGHNDRKFMLNSSYMLHGNCTTLDSGIDVAPGINVAPGTSGKNIKRSP